MGGGRSRCQTAGGADICRGQISQAHFYGAGVKVGGWLPADALAGASASRG